jgi:hypothetical protein
MDPETLDQLAAELERHPIGGRHRQPSLGPYLDAISEALGEQGLDRVHVDYSDVGSSRNRWKAPRFEPADVLVPEELSRLVLAVTDRIVPPPQRDRHVFMSRDEVVTIDPSRKPRAGLFREGMRFDEIEVAARDDSELLQFNRILRSCSPIEVKAMFDHGLDGRATVKKVETTPTVAILPAELVERIRNWVIRIVERQPIDPSMLHAGGFVLFEPDKEIATLHHRTSRMVATDRSVD